MKNRLCLAWLWLAITTALTACSSDEVNFSAPSSGSNPPKVVTEDVAPANQAPVLDPLTSTLQGSPASPADGRAQQSNGQIEDPALRAAYIAARQAEVANDPGYALSDATKYSTTLRAMGDPRAVTHRAISTAKSMQTEFVDDGAVRVSPTGRADEVAAQAFELKLVRWGSEQQLVDVPAITDRKAAGNRIELQRGAITEWYVNGPMGLEQGFTLAQAPQSNSGPLVIELAVEGATPKLDAEGRTVSFSRTEGVSVGGYSDLFVKDAKGKQLTATLDVDDGAIRISVDAKGAAFPVVVDPVVWVGTKLARIGGGAANDRFGQAVAVDGDTAVVGAQADDDNGTDSGSAYIFRQLGGAWVQQAKLLPAASSDSDFFGIAVAISGDSVLIGASRDDDKGSDSGSVYVFTRDGSTWSQQGTKLLPSDASVNGYFGMSVAISGNTALIGAQGDIANGSNSGSVYVFTRSSNIWTVQQKFQPSDGDPGDLFGQSVALSGDTALVGASGDDERGINAGAVYAFTRSEDTWIQQGPKLLPPADSGGDNFGYSVALSGDTAIIGAYLDDDLNTNSGAAYVFTRIGSIWSQQQKLLPAVGVMSGNFGFSVALSGDQALIGAHPVGSGSAYVFTRSGTTWTEREPILVAADGTAADFFGYAVAISGDNALVGAHQDDDEGSSSGSAYLFGRAGGAWLQRAKLLPSDASSSDNFGGAVAVDGNTAIVGAIGDNVYDPQSGSAYVFFRSGQTWVQQQKLIPDDGAMYDYFGSAVAIDGDTALVGAKYDDVSGTDQGSVYVFVRSTNTWTQQQKLTANDGYSLEGFGSTLGLSGDSAVVGASNHGHSRPGAGAAYVFTRSNNVWTQQQELEASDAARDDHFGMSVAISGDSVIVGAADDDDLGSQAGSAYVFTRTDTLWSQQQKLLPSDGVLDDHFGASVDLSGSTAIVGSYGDDDNGGTTGSAYVFTRTDAVWTQQQKLLPSGVTGGDYFGDRVAVDGDVAIVGAYGDDAKGSSAGAAYVFVRVADVWSVQQKLLASDGANSDYFGRALDISGNYALVGVAEDDDGGFASGSTYVFRADPGDALQGAPCTEDGQCSSSNVCVEGVCCDAACSGTCQSCAQWHKADNSADGTCGLVAEGSACGSTPNDCFSDTEYALTSVCNANGVCQPQIVECQGGFACVAGDVGGLCVSDCRLNGPQHSRCADEHWCESDGTCQPDKIGGDSCSDDEECESNQCVGSVCTKTLGQVCGGAGECKSGFCQDSHCCNIECGNPCQACDISGHLGTCTMVPAAPEDGVPHHGLCQSGHPDCGDGFCGGSQSDCVFAENTPCGPVSCNDATDQVSGKTCSQSGQCSVDSLNSCGHYSCADATSCATSCASHDDCSADFRCDLSTNNCVAKLNDGDDCTANAECGSNHCIDGVCCHTACGAQCEACDVPGHEGTCAAVTDEPHGTRPSCGGSDPACMGQCDGQKRDGCAFPDLATTCGAPTCSAGVAHPQVCNGEGDCVDGTTKNCAPFACNSDHDACADTCASDTACASGATCDVMANECAFTDGTCLDLFTLELSDGSEQSCSPFICQSGACLRECQANDECADGFECLDQICEEVVDTTGPAGGDAGTNDDTNGGRAQAAQAGSSGGGCSVGVRDRGRSHDSALWSLALVIAAGLRRKQWVK